MSSKSFTIDFDLPEELIATHPSQKRDHCRMLVVDRTSGNIQHSTFDLLGSFLSSDYFLLMNQAKVDPSRIFWTDPKGKKQEIVFLKNIENADSSSTWEAIVSGKKLKVGTPYFITDSASFELLRDRENSIALIRLNRSAPQVQQLLREKGQLPLPPYILSKRRQAGEADYSMQDAGDYQTVYSKTSGAVASPTAGLHFTKETFADLKSKKIEHDFIHLAVGWGTFSPLTEHHFETKKLHPEFCSLSSALAQKIIKQKQNNKKILAVGTTTVRTLETWAQNGMKESGFEGETDIFITPGDRFLVTDAMLTNFHIPQSSLLLLVAAFLGDSSEKRILEIYREAIAQKYRFYSYGDCMLIL